MQPTSVTITFFGSGPVAAASLELLAKHQTIEAVITKPQPPHHRERFPVLEVAERLGLPVLETANKQQLAELFASKPVTSHLGVVIDYGIIMPQAVIDSFELGIVNSHFSLLPRWRGADPISFAILEGDAETGVSLMLIVEKLDEGDLLAQRSLIIDPADTTPSLTDKLVSLSDSLLLQTLPAYLAGALKPYAQASDGVNYSRKLTKADSVLDWQQPAAKLVREVRAFTGWPRSRTKIGSTDVIITKAHALADNPNNGIAGTLYLDGSKIGIHTANGVFIIDTLIPAGKKEMPAAAFLAGYKPQ